MFNNQEKLDGLHNRLSDSIFKTVSYKFDELRNQLKESQVLVETPDLNNILLYNSYVQDLNRKIQTAMLGGLNFVKLTVEPTEEVKEYYENRGYNFTSKTIDNNIPSSGTCYHRYDSREFVPVIEWKV